MLTAIQTIDFFISCTSGREIPVIHRHQPLDDCGTLGVGPTRIRGLAPFDAANDCFAGVSGGMLRKESKEVRAWRPRRQKRLSGMRAFLAIDVAMPPGWTTVTPMRVSASSWRKDSEKPRTANLLAA